MNNTANSRWHESAGHIMCLAAAGVLLSGGLAAADCQGRFSSDVKKDSIKQTPSITVKKEIYASSPEPGIGISVSMYYVGRGCRREEIRCLVRTSDLSDTPQRRISGDDGQTWSDWEFIDSEYEKQGNLVQTSGPTSYGTGVYDPASGCLIKPSLQRIIKGDPVVALAEIWKGNRLFADHGFYQLSCDNGLSWSNPFMLKYEEGPDFDPLDWGHPLYFRTNEMYIGKAVALQNGTVIITATVPVPFTDEEDDTIPTFYPGDMRPGCVAGGICFIGRWDSDRKIYTWVTSDPVFLPRRVSTRGLDELDIAELKDGNLMMIIRGSNSGLDPDQCPGRRWYTISEDGGHSWSKIEDIKYDTGESLYSPASISSTIRSSVNGKLYWIGNISSSPVKGNGPRYPLYIVEIDEDSHSFIKETLTTIDDRNPAEDSVFLQLSNFFVLEDYKTHSIEIYLTRLGQRGEGKDLWSADAYKYTISISK
mgnify:CR=1 FL=1